jgi:predicted nucleic acid-binding protein
LIKEGRARILAVVRQELLSCIKTTEQLEKLRITLRSFPDERLDTADYEAAARASNVCRSKGVAVSVVDALICAVGTARDWSIFTTDPDFRNYATFLPIRLHAPRE